MVIQTDFLNLMEKLSYLVKLKDFQMNLDLQMRRAKLTLRDLLRDLLMSLEKQRQRVIQMVILMKKD